MPNKEPKFDFRRYELDQIIEALTCPINRHATRVEHDCTDWELHKNPKLLIIHFIEKGGAVEFSKRRGEFVSLCEFSESCRMSQTCDLSLMQSDFEKCPLRKLSERCRCGCQFACSTHHTKENPIEDELAYPI
jgi:hypothetical protein